jgi:nitrogen regulatory protein PII
MRSKYIQAKLLITIVERHNDALVMAAAKQAGARGGTKSFGRGIAAYNTPGGRAEADTQEVLTFILMLENHEKIIQAIKNAATEEPESFTGMGMLFDVPSMFARADAALLASAGNAPALDTTDTTDSNAPDNAPESARSEHMKTGTVMICSIINHGDADEIMAAARNAGAKGGTILNARGTGTEEDVKFFGISLAPEKEVLLILAEQDNEQAILDAISNLPLFNEPGGGILFTTGVEQFIIFGK